MRQAVRKNRAVSTKRAAHKKHRRTAAGSAARAMNTPLSRKERRICMQWVACGSICVLLVAVKLLLPGKLDGIGRRVSEAMQTNMDVQAVFSVIGKAAAGERDAQGALSDVYKAVFSGQESVAVMQTAVISANADTAALEELREFRENAAEEEEQQAEQASLTYVMYSDENLPDNVSMEQAILGFAYSSPLEGTLSSDFGYRDHPTEGTERFHYGIDLAAEEGDVINCFADGTVKAVGESSSYGKYLIVSHSGGVDTLYAHCSTVTVSSGQEVQQGEPIAKVGSTGMATGPHLHFELLRDNIYLNPIYYVSAA